MILLLSIVTADYVNEELTDGDAKNGSVRQEKLVSVENRDEAGGSTGNDGGDIVNEHTVDTRTVDQQSSEYTGCRVTDAEHRENETGPPLVHS